MMNKVFKETNRPSGRSLPRQHELNPEKCTFVVRVGKFLRFYLTERGIEVNPDKCKYVAEMRPPTTKKEIQKLTGMIVALSSFISKAANKSFPLHS